MKVPAAVRGPYVVARHELRVNLKSPRLLIMLVVLALVVIGGVYNQSAGSGIGGPQLSPFILWGHPSIAPGGEHVAVAWLSDPFGRPLAGRTVSFLTTQDGVEVQLGDAPTDAEGFARLAVGTRAEVTLLVQIGGAEWRVGVDFLQTVSNFTISSHHENLDNDGFRDDLLIHVLTQAGAPAAARIYLEDTFAKPVDARGYARVEVPPGESNVTVEVDGERQTIRSLVPVGLFSSTPDFVLLVTATVFVSFVVPIVAIVLAFDAISKERVQGTLDLLLSRPISRVGTLLGKFAGTFAAVTVPVTLMSLVGIGVISGLMGRPPTARLAAAFLGLELLLIAFYLLLQLMLSSLAKTNGTAILFGVLAWLAFNVLYPVITLVLSSILFPNDLLAQLEFGRVSGIGNPSWIYQQLLTFAAPDERGGGFPSSPLGLHTVALAAGAWLTFLLALALWTFQRKVAE